MTKFDVGEGELDVGGVGRGCVMCPGGIDTPDMWDKDIMKIRTWALSS